MKHLYGIVPTSSEIGAVLSLRRPEPVEGSKGVGPDIVGVHGFPVHTLTHNGVTAIVSDSRYDDYSRLSKPALVQVLADHQRVTETLMPHTSVLLPVKFGTLLPDKGVHALLAQSSGDFEAAFQTLTGKVEVEVVATWQPGRVLAEIAQEPTVVQLRAAAVGRSSAEVQRIQIVLGQIVMAGLEERKAAYQKQILDSLRDMVDDMEINLALNEQVVANLAFLLPSAKQAEFDQRIEALDARLHGQLDFKIVGPLPAHSFSTVEVLKINAEATGPRRTRFARPFCVKPACIIRTRPRTTRWRRSNSPTSTKPTSCCVTVMRSNIRRLGCLLGMAQGWTCQRVNSAATSRRLR
jgi:hypothetical protein